MTLQIAVIVSSVAGAILFFFSGYWTARSAPSPFSEAPTLKDSAGRTDRHNRMVSSHGSGPVADDASAAQELGALRGKITAYRKLLSESEQERGRIANLEEELQQLHEERNTLKASTSQELNALQDVITAYRKRFADAERERERTVNLEEEIRHLHDKHNTLLDESRQLHEKWKEKAHQAGALWDEKSDLKQRLRQALDDLKELEAGRKQSAIEYETMHRQIAALEHYKEESARLSSLITEIPYLRTTVDELKQENRELRSLGLVYRPPAATVKTTPAEHIGGSIQHLLEQFSENTGARGAALADDHGLLVAGTSEYAESLAVTGALCDGLMTQMADILPLGSLRQLVMVDSNGVTAAIYPFRFGSDQLMLASLSVGPGPDSEAIADLVNQASRLLGGVRKDKDQKDRNFSASS